jgi:putative endonuclease
MSKPVPYLVYILECGDATLYIGCTNDIERRLKQHNASKSGARYTKARRPVTLRYTEQFATQGDALRRECELKKLTRAQKLALIA